MRRAKLHGMIAAFAFGAVVCAVRGAGAAAGATPASAPAAVDTSRVRLGAADTGTDAFVAWPAGKRGAPAVIVIQEWWGLNEQIREVARRLAREGYVSIVPDLYHGKVADDAEMAHTLVRGLDDERALTDLDAALRWLRAQERTAKSKVGVVGFCMGGRLSELFALNEPGVAAAVMYYGRPVTNPTLLAKLKAPLQGHFGAEDQGIPADSVAALRAALAAAGKKAEIHLYPGAGHAFMNESRKSYHPEAARQAWERTLTFFKRYVKG